MPMMSLRTDKKGRPYSVCQACGVKTFYKTTGSYESFLRMTEEHGKVAGPALIEVMQRQLAEISRNKPTQTTFPVAPVEIVKEVAP